MIARRSEDWTIERGSREETRWGRGMESSDLIMAGLDRAVSGNSQYPQHYGIYGGTV